MNNDTLTIKTKNDEILITRQQAEEWSQEQEKFSFVCDEFGLYAHQEFLIERIERGFEKLLQK
jgi:hypothetical protein